MFNNLTAKRITIFGVTFKANTNDVRCSAAITIIEALLNEGAIL
jgi:UDP-glucose 6-dehydrogenase